MDVVDEWRGWSNLCRKGLGRKCAQPLGLSQGLDGMPVFGVVVTPEARIFAR